MSLQKGCVLHMPLDQESYNPATRRLTDKSAYRNHGISDVAANFTADRMGQTNRAMLLNGVDDCIEIPHDDRLNLVDDFTASVRIKPTDILGSPQGIFSKSNYALKEYDDEYIWQIIGPGAGWGNQLAAGSSPRELCTYDGKLYCACNSSNNVYVFDGTSWTISGSVGTGPLGLCTYDGKLYCGCYSSHNVYVFDGTSWTDSGSVGTGPFGLCTYDGKLYCACTSSNNVYVFDGTTWTNSGSVGYAPRGLCAYDGKLYCACTSSHRVYVFDGTSWTNSGSVGNNPRGLCTYDGKLYCACAHTASNNVYVFDGTSWTNSGSVGTNPLGLCTYDGKLYCGCDGSNNVYAFDGTSWTLSGSVGNGSFSLGTYNGKLYCSCHSSNNIYEFGTGQAVRIDRTTDWDLVHVEYTSTSMSITLNNDVANKVTASHSLALNNNALGLKIGASYGSSQSGFTGGNDEHFKGLFGEIRMYGRILSADEQTLIKDSYRPKVTMNLLKGCVLHAPLDQESYNPSTLRFTDKSGHGNHGTSTNAVNFFAADRMGQLNRAMTFNGATDVINCGNDDSLNTINIMGICARIKLSVFVGQNVIVSKWITGGQYSYIFDLSGAYPRLLMSSNGTTVTAHVQTDNGINIDQWYDIVVVYNGTAQTVDFYIDGSIVTSSVISGTIPASIHQSTDQVNIGQTTGGNLHGDIAETRIYNRALTESEITYLYESYRT